jgi:subtilase family serine protease
MNTNKTASSKLVCGGWMGAALVFLLTSQAPAAEIQTLQGQVPSAVTTLHLRPVGRLPAKSRLHIGFTLPPRNQDALVKLAHDVQDPARADFRRYLTPKQFNERFAPTEADYQAVVRFAETHSLTVTHLVPGRTMVEAEGIVADLEKAFHVTLCLYQHPPEARTFYAPDAEPSLDLEVSVLDICGLNNYFLPQARCGAGSSILGTGSYTNDNTQPCWGNLFIGYDFRRAFAPDTTLDGSGQTVGLFELDGFTPGDITNYEVTAGLPLVPVQEVLLDGMTNDPNNGDIEPPIDIDMAIAMAPGLDKVVFYHGSSTNVDAILTEMADPTQGEGLPKQISCSWGFDTDNNTSNCFHRLSTQGQSFFYAVGDQGAYPVLPNGPQGGFIDHALPSDLAPYMTHVGGTELSMNGLGESWSNETVWGDSGTHGSGGDSGTGGGILSTIPIPDYQTWINMTAVGGSDTHCDVPDVAMPSDNILLFSTTTNGQQNSYNANGTSCAAPLWAGFAALANQQAEAQGQPALGFLNPALYAAAQGPLYAYCFHDITVGNNTWSNSPNAYFAAPGYDLCSGLGSPTGAALIDALVGPPGNVFVDFNYTGSIQNGTTTYPFPTLDQGISAVTAGGTIIIETPGSSIETPTISKPMTIIVIDGPDTIGH